LLSLGFLVVMIDYTLPLDKLPNPLPIEPLKKPFDVTITPPGSKSITCRAYVLAALAKGQSKIIRPLRADDTDKLLGALCTLGAQARWEGEDVYITGVNGRFPKGGSVNLGDGGAPTRFMIACACLAAEPVIVDGSNRMRERPIAEGVNMLRHLGAKIEYVEAEGRLPVRVVPRMEFGGGELTVGETLSSQFISALLLIAPCLGAPLTLHFSRHMTSAKYVMLTQSVMSEWDCMCDFDTDLADGARNLWDSDSSSVRHGRIGVTPRPIDARTSVVERDASSALYWICAAAVVPTAQVTIAHFCPESGQPDAWLVSVIEHSVCGLGGQLTESETPPSLTMRGGSGIRGGTLNGIESPDGSVAIVAIAAVSKAQWHVTGLHTLRHKETDRIAALANELRRIGCTIETTDDSITIDPSTRHDKPVTIETYNDHRMAMAFAVLGLARPGISIKDPHVVSKSYPTFWKDFAKLYQ
jgi:3-phosphoshikimate 1-carboxyvinyltransferase